MRQTWDQAIGATPPSTIDVDDLVVRARRRGLRRWAVAGAAGGTAVAAVGVIAAIMLNSAGPPPSTSKVEAGASSTPTAAAAAPVHAGETRAQSEQRITTALTDGLTAALPGVHLSDGVTGQPGVVLTSEPGQSTGFDMDTVLTLATVQGEVFFQSWSGAATPPSGPSDQPSNQPAPPTVVDWFTSCAGLDRGTAVNGDGYALAYDCTESVGPAGQQIVSFTERCPGCPGQPVDRHDVYVNWSNARVELTVTSDTKRGPSTGAMAPPLTLDQVLAIAINPDLTVTS